MERYENECKMLSYLARRQLNLPKNAKKPDFETMELDEIDIKMFEELHELSHELFEKPSLDYIRCFEELGDCAAMLVGFIAKLNQMKGTLQ